MVEWVLWLQKSFNLPAAATAEALALHLDSCRIVRAAQLHKVPGAQGSQLEAPSAEEADLLEGVKYDWASNLCAAAVWSALASVLLSAARSAVQASQRATRLPGSVPHHTFVDTSSGADPLEQSQHAADLESWQTVLDVLQSRAWWWDKCVLTPQAVLALGRNAAADQLASMAVAAAFMLGPSSAFCSHAMEALEAIAAPAAALLLKDAAQLSAQLARPP